MSTQQEILEIVLFIKDNAVMRSEMDAKLSSLRSDIMNHIDSFTRLYERHDHEITALHHRVDLLEAKN